MRFLSKKSVWILLFVVMIVANVFLYQYQSRFCVAGYCLNSNTLNSVKDNTVFNLNYNGRVWVIYASEFELDSNLFSLDARINNLNRNGSRVNKIDLLNKLIKINISPEIAFNYIYLGFNNKLNKIQKNMEKPAQNAKIKINNNKINIKNEIIGIKLNKYLFYNNLIKVYSKGDKIVNINIPIIKSNPQITSKDLKQYTYKRSEFTTSISTSNAGRKFNIRKALNAINGTCLSKMQKFSFNQTVGRRTEDRGYKSAKVILDGEFVEGVGGGVCQVSSTLYNAVLLAGLNVISSQKHSQRVGYVKAGFDAMVNYGTSDLVFENNTNGEVYILTNYTNENITISIYGANLNNVSYDRYYEVSNRVEPSETKIMYDHEGQYIDKVNYIDECFELKSSKEGYTIKSYLIKLVDGVEQDRKLLRSDKYLPQQRVIVYGTKARGLLAMSFDETNNG